MRTNDHNPIADLLRRLALKCGYGSLTHEQAQAKYDAAEPDEVSQELAERIAKAVASGQNPRRSLVVPSFLPELQAAGVEDETLAVLNRNRGEDDPETAKRLEELRRKALDEDEDDCSEDEVRLED